MRRLNLPFLGCKSGFTLTEILIVIVIIAVLATLALPMLVKTIEKAKIGEAASNLNLIRTGEKIYFLEYGIYWNDINDLNIEDPNTPVSRYFNYAITAADGTDFTAQATRRDGDYQDPIVIQKDGRITSTGPFFPE